MNKDVAEQQKNSAAAQRQALRLQATSEHLTELSHDKIPGIFPTFFSHSLGAQQGFLMPVWFKRDESVATGCVEDLRGESKSWKKSTERRKAGVKNREQAHG